MMMKKKVLILIADSNMWFSYGLSQGLFMHLSALGWNVTVTNRLSDKRDADLIFAAKDLPPGHLRPLTKCGSGRKTKLVFIINDKGNNIPIYKPYTIDGVINRHQSLEEIMTLVTEKVEANLALLNNAQPIRLSLREAEVMGYFNDGYCPIDIAKALGINVKAVSRNKRSVMKKLDIYRTSELCLWLFSGGLNGFLNHRAKPEESNSVLPESPRY
ncbi:hypothetical protein JHW33_00455 [Rahnella aceris]|uniref:helix-turn-helix transcriptional regulator n=1 Tax=Rahnella sp. (strain Y9602) TaxID=2703885 RepID=UPI001903241A|nr:LuxR C-terminal-related transcriptional regulator [Rahnella aceris]QQN35157.1 hypothetical protein JHW33_00455 [Rahnella aceris]